MATVEKNKTRGSSQGLLRSPVSPPASPVLPAVSPEGKSKVDVLIDQVNRLVLSEENKLSRQQEDYVKECFLKACIDGETLEYAIERLRHLCFSNRSIIPTIAVTFNVLWNFEVDKVKLKSVLLSRLQSDHENRSEMQATSPKKFLNAVALLGEIYARVRIGKYPISALSTPVVEYLEALLSGDESEVELFAHMLILISHSLREDLREAGSSNHASLLSCGPFQNILTKVRSTLMSRNLSSQCRLWLLFIMDFTSSGDFKAPSSSLQQFYMEKDHLGAQADFLFQSVQLPEMSESIPTSPRQGEVVVTNEELTVSEKVSHISISPKQNEKILAPKSSSTDFKRSSPEKSVGVDKRENFRSAFQVDSSKGKGSKSYWSHDDRFEKEEESNKSMDKPAARVTRPRASDGNWRQPHSAREEKEIKTNANSSWRPQGQKDNRVKAEVKPAGLSNPVVDVLAGRVDEENWDN